MTTKAIGKVGAALSDAPMVVESVTLKSILQSQSVKKRFEEVLGKKASGFISSILSAVSSNRALALCDPMSVVASGAVAASLDLPINSSLGFAHIVPYSGVAQFQMGWKGFVQLGMRSGKYETMNAATVYEGELKRHDNFTGEMEFDEAGKKSNKIIGYLFYFRLLNGYRKFFYMTHEQMEIHARRYSKLYSSGKGRWVDDFESMALKTVVKLGLSKWGILSIEMQKSIDFDQAKVTKDEKPEYIDTPDFQSEEISEKQETVSPKEDRNIASDCQ